MKRCPKCGGSITSATVSGPLVYARAEVVFNGPAVKAVGPIVATSVIKPGQELKTKGLTMECPHCRYTARVTDFESVIQCAVTGEPLSQDSAATLQLGGMTLYISQEEYPHAISAARQVSQLSRTWRNPRT